MTYMFIILTIIFRNSISEHYGIARTECDSRTAGVQN